MKNFNLEVHIGEKLSVTFLFSGLPDDIVPSAITFDFTTNISSAVEALAPDRIPNGVSPEELMKKCALMSAESVAKWYHANVFLIEPDAHLMIQGIQKWNENIKF